MDEPRVSDLSDLLAIAQRYSPTGSDAERVAALLAAAINRQYGPRSKMASVARLSFGSDSSTRGLSVPQRHKIAWEAYGANSLSNFKTHVTPAMHQDLARQITLIYESGESVAATEIVQGEMEIDRPRSDQGDTPEARLELLVRRVVEIRRAALIAIFVVRLERELRASGFEDDRLYYPNALVVESRCREELLSAFELFSEWGSHLIDEGYKAEDYLPLLEDRALSEVLTLESDVHEWLPRPEAVDVTQLPYAAFEMARMEELDDHGELREWYECETFDPMVPWFRLQLGYRLSFDSLIYPIQENVGDPRGPSGLEVLAAKTGRIQRLIGRGPHHLNPFIPEARRIALKQIGSFYRRDEFLPLAGGLSLRNRAENFLAQIDDELDTEDKVWYKKTE